MSIDPSAISQLLYRYVSGETLDAEELTLLEKWLQAAPENRALVNELEDTISLQSSLKQWKQLEKKTEEDWQLFAGKLKEGTERKQGSYFSFSRYWKQYAAAAVLVVLAGMWIWYAEKEIPADSSATTASDQPIILPGREGAVLTLADGKQLSLDSLKNGLVAEQSGTTISLENGQLAYHEGKSAEVKQNTITTPNGRQFHVQLPDGTHVWLNAASSITYPTAFPGSQRRVAITGEAYFEVAAMEKKPFIVDITTMATVEVLGTSFNINAYSDEAYIKTTLLSGSVKVKTDREEALLKPGEQARITNGQATAAMNIQRAGTEQELAWKNGFFNFNDEDIPAFLRQLERWYDIDVKYDGTVPGMTFKGGLDRNASLTEILKVLSKLNIKYRLDGRTLIVGEK